MFLVMAMLNYVPYGFRFLLHYCIDPDNGVCVKSLMVGQVRMLGVPVDSPV